MTAVYEKGDYRDCVQDRQMMGFLLIDQIKLRFLVEIALSKMSVVIDEGAFILKNLH